MNSSGALNRGEVYAGGRHLATYTGGTGGTTIFDHADWIGSERMRTQVSGQSCETIVSLAFGDGQATSGSCSDASPMHFTGKMRDAETNLDDFDARYYSSQWGRFISADWSAVPAPVPYANLTNPQTLNLYAIVHDNVETFADLDGHGPVGPGGGPPMPNWQNSPGFYDDSTRNSPCTLDGIPVSCEFAQEMAEQGAVVADNGVLMNDTSNGQADPVNAQAFTQEVAAQQQTGAAAQQKNNSQSQANQPSQTNQQPSSWDKTKPLPTDPSKLGPEWKKNPKYKNPNGEEYINDKTGEKLEWNKGRPGPWGPKADRGRDGWHYTPPGGVRGKQMDPGQVLKTTAKVGFWGAVGVAVVRAGAAAAEACSEVGCEAW